MKVQDLRLELEGKLYSKENIDIHLKALESNSIDEDKDKTLQKEVLSFLKEWFSPAPYINVQTSGSTGSTKRLQVSKKAMLCSARQTCQALNLKKGDTAILCISPKYIGGIMMIVRAMLQKMKLILAPVQTNPLLNFNTRANFIALVPMQVRSILSDKKTNIFFKQIDKVIIGGASLSAELLDRLKDFPNAIYSTYGMTETLSHIALKRISGATAEKAYYPLEGIKLQLSEEGSLNILAPYISSDWLETNDLAQLNDDGSFELLGRKDNVVNSGGIKLQIEQLEEKIKAILPYSIALTSVADEELGEALVMLIAKKQEAIEASEELLSKLKSELPRYSAPKHIIYCEAIPLTANGKINRKACKDLAKAKYLS